MEILKPIFCAIALMGIHITSPLMSIFTITDLQNVLSALDHETLSKKETSLNYKCFRPGDYVAAFWIDSSGKYEWFLANVVEICSNDTFLLSYCIKIGHRKKKVKFGYLLKCLSLLKQTSTILLVKALMFHTFAQIK